MLGVLALLALSLGIGVLARRLPAFPEQTPRVLNAVVLNVALPALVIRVMHDVPLSGSLVVAAGTMWAQFLAAIGFFALLRRVVGFSRGTFGALVLTGGLSNSAFIGLPVIEMVLGPGALGPAVFVDQLGSFLVMATLGIAVAAAASGQTTDPRTVARRILLFPPFIALAVALVLRPVDFPPWVLVVLDRIGGLLTPLALISVGFQLRLGTLASRKALVAAGLAFKLVLAPAVIAAALVATGLMQPGTVPFQVAVLQCAMPPMITGGILASEYDCDPPLASAMLGVGIPLSAATVAIAIALVR